MEVTRSSQNAEPFVRRTNREANSSGYLSKFSEKIYTGLTLIDANMLIHRFSFNLKRHTNKVAWKCKQNIKNL
ncbi:hypothetical protein ACU4GD_17910 [Cupriavidus basilensis]